MKALTHKPPGRRAEVRAFTLVELLVVIAIIAVLAALLLPALARGKAQAQASGCRNRLRQMGLAMTLYLSDSRRYPPMWDTETSQLWPEKLYPQDPLSWTNISWNCPTYIAHKGIVRYLKPPLGDDISISYSYNWHGTIGYRGCPRAMYRLKLGLGHLSKDAAPEPQVLVPSEMYTVADARPVVGQAGLDGNPKMQLYGFGETKEAPPPHARGYNILFADGHVTFVKRSDYLCPPRTAHNWNRDNQPHPETWAPTDQWAAQN